MPELNYELAPRPGMPASQRKQELDSARFVAVRNLAYMIYKKPDGSQAGQGGGRRRRGAAGGAVATPTGAAVAPPPGGPPPGMPMQPGVPPAGPALGPGPVGVPGTHAPVGQPAFQQTYAAPVGTVQQLDLGPLLQRLESIGAELGRGLSAISKDVDDLKKLTGSLAATQLQTLSALQHVYGSFPNLLEFLQKNQVGATLADFQKFLSRFTGNPT
jgi:hypothetical protein